MLKRVNTTVKDTYRNIFLGESAFKQYVANCLMATVYETIILWYTEDLYGISHAGNRYVWW